MGRLTQGMYGSQFRPTEDLFGLRCGQMRGGDTRLCKNSGWYNRAGERLGWGDLNTVEVQRIITGLEEGELFIVLFEQDAFWNFVTHNPGIIGSMCTTKSTVEAPGVDYVAEHCHYIFAPGRAYLVSDQTHAHWRPKDFTKDDLAIKVLTRDEAKALIGKAQPVT